MDRIERNIALNDNEKYDGFLVLNKTLSFGIWDPYIYMQQGSYYY